MAPELHQPNGYLQYKGPPVDLFACGVILFFMIARKDPFDRADSNDARYKCIMSNNTSHFWKL